MNMENELRVGPGMQMRSGLEERTAYLESLIRDDFERCHPGDTLEDLKRRARFSPGDGGLLRDWMKEAARRAKNGNGAPPTSLRRTPSISAASTIRP